MKKITYIINIMIDIKIKNKKNNEKKEKHPNFVTQQFSRLLRRNLKIPITLFQL